jgi:hypothetical protein
MLFFNNQSSECGLAGVREREGKNVNDVVPLLLTKTKGMRRQSIYKAGG